MSRAIHSFEDDADSILRSMGLNREILEEVCRRGLAQYFTATVHHAKNAAGSFFYHEAVRSLRDLLISTGWEHVNEGLELTFNPELKIAIAVSSGNTCVGDRHRQPAFKHPKGPMTGTAVAGNTRQLDLFEGITELASFALPTVPARVSFSEFQTWWLLHYVDQVHGNVRAELSLPILTAGSEETNQWEIRIVLDPISFDYELSVTSDDGRGDEGSVNLDVDVRKKG